MSLSNPSLEAARRRLKSQRGWGAALMWTAPAGFLLGATSGDGSWHALAAVFFVTGLIIRGTAKHGVQLAAAARAAQIATTLGINTVALGSQIAGLILNQAMVEAATLTAQEGIPLDQAFDHFYTAGLARAIDAHL
ncbi:hypothetical protein E3T54_11805 [Cryobacterium sp. Sr8]|uniref:hypothetical protein n=1 Tax=Cryobacterium sp. Sr8 TaxID=1259203 RepID=UPI00106A36F5|nr:hypothetical protein [Cryobacterium sp. Sr8]TFD75410.1 hypothetical protein E3T54_11805 [Cryobacterium sp. Sr8]